MLIRWMTNSDMDAWKTAYEQQWLKSPDEEQIANLKQCMNQYEALTAIDYQSGKHLGFYLFHRSQDRAEQILFTDNEVNKEAEERLHRVAKRQLHIADEKERVGNSFHYNYESFIQASKEENCPVCQKKPAPMGQKLIIETDAVWVYGEYPGQARLFGKLYIMPKKHYFQFEDMPSDEMVLFMRDVQRVGHVLRSVTGAEKINYEMHANSGAHLHIHLFPRFLDDDYPSGPIDYRVSEPTPYKSKEEFDWFIEQMRAQLQ